MRSCWIHGSETWPMTERKLDISEAHVLRWLCGLKITVKPVLFACPLFCEFCDLGDFAKITGREYTL